MQTDGSCSILLSSIWGQVTHHGPDSGTSLCGKCLCVAVGMCQLRKPLSCGALVKAHSLSWKGPPWILGVIPQDLHVCPGSGFEKNGSAITSTGDRYVPVLPLSMTPGHGCPSQGCSSATQPRAARTVEQLGQRTEGAEALPDS